MRTCLDPAGALYPEASVWILDKKMLMDQASRWAALLLLLLLLLRKGIYALKNCCCAWYQHLHVHGWGHEQGCTMHAVAPVIPIKFSLLPTATL